MAPAGFPVCARASLARPRVRGSLRPSELRPVSCRAVRSAPRRRPHQESSATSSAGRPAASRSRARRRQALPTGRAVPATVPASRARHHGPGSSRRRRPGPHSRHRAASPVTRAASRPPRSKGSPAASPAARRVRRTRSHRDRPRRLGRSPVWTGTAAYPVCGHASRVKRHGQVSSLGRPHCRQGRSIATTAGSRRDASRRHRRVRSLSAMAPAAFPACVRADPVRRRGRG